MILMLLAEDEMAPAKTSGHSTVERHAPLLYPCHHSSVCPTTFHRPQMTSSCILLDASISRA
jgi:hypothetical protein